MKRQSDTSLELGLLLDAIFRKYHYDFRRYSGASLRRRLSTAMSQFSCATLSQLQDRVIHEPKVFAELLRFLTVQVSDLFRDPTYFRSIREKVVPYLRTYPSLKVWVAGCATGEEAYSLAILLAEEGLLERSLMKAILFSDHSLATDSAFAEVELVSCRNVLIYFEKELQERAIGVLRDSLCRKGFLGLGMKETLRFSKHADAFVELVGNDRIYQRI
jgi:chemotaxis protein methyltransferase CheR